MISGSPVPRRITSRSRPRAFITYFSSPSSIASPSGQVRLSASGRLSSIYRLKQVINKWHGHEKHFPQVWRYAYTKYLPDCSEEMPIAYNNEISATKIS